MIKFIVHRQVKGPNIREHHFARARRVKAERSSVCGSLLVQCGPDWKQQLGGPPYVVTLVRVGPHGLDEDNVQGACKAIRDQVAAELGLDDSPRSPITWRYEQRKGEYGVEVRIESAAEQQRTA